jgi:hypothetical protein
LGYCYTVAGRAIGFALEQPLHVVALACSAYGILKQLEYKPKPVWAIGFALLPKISSLGVVKTASKKTCEIISHSLFLSTPPPKIKKSKFTLYTTIFFCPAFLRDKRDIKDRRNAKVTRDKITIYSILLGEFV